MTNKSKAIAFKYLKAPISAIATRRNDYSPTNGGDQVLVAAGGGSSKTGVLNTICVLRCAPGADAAEGIQLKEEARISTGSNLVVGIAISPSGNYVGTITGRSCTLYRWNTTTTTNTTDQDILVPVVTFEAISLYTDSSSSSSSSSSASASTTTTDDTVNEESNLSALTFSADETHIAFGDRRGRITVWKIGERSFSSSSSSIPSSPVAPTLSLFSTPKHQFLIHCHTKQINSIAFTPSYRPISESISSSASSSPSTAKDNHTIPKHDQYRLVSASNDGTTRIWSCDFLWKETGASTPSTTTSTPLPSTIQCHVIRSQGLEQFKTTTVRGSNINKRILSLWSNDTSILDGTGKCLYTLESNYYHGSLINKWRCITFESKNSNDKDRKKITDSKVCSTTEEISLSTSRMVESVSSLATDSVWILSSSRHVSKTPLSTMTINNTFNRLALTTIGGVVFFDTDTMSLLWTDTGLASGMDTSSVSFVEKSSPIEGVIVGSITGELALVPLHAGGQRSRCHRNVLFFFFFLFILFLTLLLLLYVQNVQPNQVLQFFTETAATEKTTEL